MGQNRKKFSFFDSCNDIRIFLALLFYILQILFINLNYFLSWQRIIPKEYSKNVSFDQGNLGLCIYWLFNKFIRRLQVISKNLWRMIYMIIIYLSHIRIFHLSSLIISFIKDMKTTILQTISLLVVKNSREKDQIKDLQYWQAEKLCMLNSTIIFLAIKSDK